MILRVKYTAQMRFAAGRGEDEIELPDNSTLSALLLHVADRLGSEAAAHLITDAGQTHCSLLIVLNDVVVASHQASLTVLRSGDVVTLLPPIAGG